MNILITGGAGFIGRTLHEKLYRQGHKVTLLDKKEPFLIDSDLVSYIQSDVCNRERMESLITENQFDGVVHLAAVSRVVDAQNDPEECVRTNIGGIVSLLDGIQKSRKKPWLIFGSSREVYGEPEQLPVKEDAKRTPFNIYGETKIKGEDLFIDFSKKHDLSCAVVRFSNVYGNDYDIFDRVVPRFIRAIVSGETLTIEGGEQLIDFTHINDSVEGVLKVIDYINQSGNNVREVFHLCPGIGWTLYQLIDLVEKATGKTAKIKINSKRNYDVVRFFGDTEKTHDLLGLKDFIRLEEGVSKSIHQYCHDLKVLESIE
jgi:nucleoside-diphosphate-sugar epimerase